MAEDDTRKLINRFEELASRADKLGFPQETKFLNLAEQNVLQTRFFPVPYFLFGGYPGAERRIAVFGLEEAQAGESGYSAPIVCVAIAPAARKFSDELTHRDFLGSLMALGITREVLGDIIIQDNTGYLFCLDSIADYVTENLEEVKHTTVRCARCEPPRAAANEPEPISAVIASERLDAMIAAVYRVSREEARLLIEKGLVYIDGRLAVKPAVTLKEDALVTVRGKGRFRFLGVERETKKQKLRVRVTVY